jgi:hypothetical protein
LRDWIKQVLQESNGKVTFSHLATGLRAHEISRTFLSVLMLANAGDVELSRDKSCVDKEDFTIKLLKKKEQRIDSDETFDESS